MKKTESIERAETRAWESLNEAIVSYRGEPVGTAAALDVRPDPVNYHHVFVRDFAVTATAFLARGEHAIVRSFLETLVEVQPVDRHMDCFRPGPGMMPASFTVVRDDGDESDDAIEADFGERAIGRVSPIDSGLWFLWLLRAYTRASGDVAFAERDDVRRAIELTLDTYLETRFEMYPTLLVPDGPYVIDRRMGVYGHPIDVQSLFFAGLRSAAELLEGDDAWKDLYDAVVSRLGAVAYHVRHYYWVDFARVNGLYRNAVEEFGVEAVNHFNIQPNSIPRWAADWLDGDDGYFAGNLGPSRIDFRFFAYGNLVAILTRLATDDQADRLLDLIEHREDDLIGDMPMKMVFPALEGRDWEVLTGYDPKNIAWSYHNGGSWPSLLWVLSAAARARGRDGLAERALDTASKRLADDDWPEYYDGRRGRLIGKFSRVKQTWSMAGFLAACALAESDDLLDWFAFSDDVEEGGCAVEDPVSS